MPDRDSYNRLIEEIAQLRRDLRKEENHEHPDPSRNRAPSGSITGASLVRGSSQSVSASTDEVIAYDTTQWQEGSDVTVVTLGGGELALHIETPGMYGISVYDLFTGGVDWSLIAVSTDAYTFQAPGIDNGGGTAYMNAYWPVPIYEPVDLVFQISHSEATSRDAGNYGMCSAVKLGTAIS